MNKLTVSKNNFQNIYKKNKELFINYKFQEIDKSSFDIALNDKEVIRQRRRINYLNRIANTDREIFQQSKDQNSQNNDDDKFCYNGMLNKREIYDNSNCFKMPFERKEREMNKLIKVEYPPSNLFGNKQEFSGLVFPQNSSPFKKISSKSKTFLN